MNIYKNLLFLQGHLVDTRDDDPKNANRSLHRSSIATRNKSPPTRSKIMNIFKSLLYLSGLQSITSRVGEDEQAFGHTYGNRAASKKAFASFGHARKPAPILGANDVCPAGCG